MTLLRTAAFLAVGTRHFTREGFLRAAKHFDNSVLERSLKGQVAIVTGANAGLGLHTCQELAKRGATVYMVCRNAAKGQEALQQVVSTSGNTDVHLAIVDVSSLADVHRFAAGWEAQQRPLHLLINNAGVLLAERGTSAEGHDLSFATNTLGSFAMALLLEPALKRSAPSKVLFISSGGMLIEKLRTTHLNNEDLKPWDGSVAYSRDKRRQVAMAERFAERWDGTGVAAFSMHPGWADTDGVRTSIPQFHKTFESRLRTIAQGIDTIIWLAAEDPSKLKSGAFYLDRSPQHKHLPLACTHYGRSDVDRLWAILEDLTARGWPEDLGKVQGNLSKCGAGGAAPRVIAATAIAAEPFDERHRSAPLL